MNKELYYTPSIEEFHVGFEYEYNNGKSWQNEIFIRGIGFAPNPKLDDCRVKYLDKEDIESLGWLFEKQHAGLEELQFSKDLGSTYDNLGLDYSLDSGYLRIAYNGLNGDTTRFSGTIKNKSELKVLMKQLGINE